MKTRAFQSRTGKLIQKIQNIWQRWGFHRYLRRWTLTQIEMHQNYFIPGPPVWTGVDMEEYLIWSGWGTVEFRSLFLTKVFGVSGTRYIYCLALVCSPVGQRGLEYPCGCITGWSAFNIHRSKPKGRNDDTVVRDISWRVRCAYVEVTVLDWAVKSQWLKSRLVSRA